MSKYFDWTVDALCKMEKDVLMTNNKIHKEFKEDDDGRLDSEQLEDIAKCSDILKDIYETRCLMHKLQSMYGDNSLPANNWVHSSQMPNDKKTTHSSFYNKNMHNAE